MSKLAKIMDSLKAAHLAVEILEASGVDLNKLAGLSNVQGPQARRINNAINVLSDELLASHQVDSPGSTVREIIGTVQDIVKLPTKPQKALPPKPKAPKKKKLKSGSSPTGSK